MSSAVNQAIEYLVQNNEFAQKVDNLIAEIMEDGKINFADTPKIILLVVESYNGVKSLKLTYNEIPQLVKGVTEHILNTKKLIPNDQKETFTNMIEIAVKLVMIRPKVKSCCMKFPCCK
tara:strand:- start:872 stop:1228 length:357 start_codon:yes stop_codon:yes gene_type:complete